MSAGLRRWVATMVGVCAAAVVAPAQEVWLAGGEVVAGSVASVADNRARIRAADGALRQVEIRRIEREVAADGVVRRFHAESRDGALADHERALLERVARGDELALPELWPATDHCSTALLDALAERLGDRKAAVRRAAALALAISAVPSAVHAALAAALDERGEALLAELAPTLTNGSCLGALAAADGGDLVARGFDAKDPATRLSMAWLGVHLEVDGARAALAKFVADRDHHRRESAAFALAEHGDATGADVLLTVAKRTRSPAQRANRGADAATRALVDRLTSRERCRACALLGALHHRPALTVLRRLADDADADVAAAARAAVGAIEADR